MTVQGWQARVDETQAKSARDRELYGRETPDRIQKALVGWLLETIRRVDPPSGYLTMGNIEELIDGTGEAAIDLDFFGRHWRIRVSEVDE